MDQIGNRWGFPLIALAVLLMCPFGQPSWAQSTMSSGEDPFAALTPQFGPEAIAWAKRQTTATTAVLEASPTFKSVMTDTLAAERRETVLGRYNLVGGRVLFRLLHDKAHPYGLISSAPAAPSGRPAGSWRTVFDLDAYNKTTSRPYTIKWINPAVECLAPDYTRCMIPLWLNGGQDNEYLEVDAGRSAPVQGGFHIAPGRNQLAWIDKDRLLVAHTTAGARILPSQFPAELHLWARGTPLASAPKLFELDPGNSLFGFYVSGAAAQRRIVLSIAKTYTNFQLKQLDLDGRAQDIPLPDQLKNFGDAAVSGDTLAVALAAPEMIEGKVYSADSIVGYDLKTHRISLIMAPPKDVFLTGEAVALKSGFAIVGVRNLQRILYTATPAGAGWSAVARLAEPAGIALDISGDEMSDQVLLKEQGLLTPPRARVIGAFGERAPVLVDSANPIADLSGYAVDIRSARSADGVMIDYYLMHPKAAAKGVTPTIMHGYGGFGVSDDPEYFCCRFGAAWTSWYARGGAFVIAAVRGGGERGGGWHLAGAGANKKKMFDDFAAVAEDLERLGFTDPRHLGVTGHSNGGVLTSGAIVLHPELYGAAVIGAPITDFSIIGHGDGGIGAGMAAEFGNWSDPADRAVMQAWDPFTNIRAGVTYPPTLTYVATTDNQVGPSHARRFVAKMQSVGAPAMLLEGTEGGHDYPDEYTQTADMVMQMSFLIDTLMKR